MKNVVVINLCVIIIMVQCSLRLTVCSELSEEELKKAAQVINEALNKHL